MLLDLGEFRGVRQYLDTDQMNVPPEFNLIVFDVQSRSVLCDNEPVDVRISVERDLVWNLDIHDPVQDQIPVKIGIRSGLDAEIIEHQVAV